jgi:peptidoglycan/LPS O-acetylase OafA/YrhL
MERDEKRWQAELTKGVLIAVAVLALLCVALIAQTFWGNGAMLAILLGGVAAFLAIRLLPGGGRQARTH